MKVKQINLRKSFAATSLFVSQLPSSTVGLLTEPYHYKNKICKVGTNFDLFPDNTLPLPPRAAIMVPKVFRATYLPQLSGPDVVVVYFKHQHLLLVSGYCDGKLPMIQSWMDNVLNYADDKGCKVVLGLDSNAHSELYGHETDRRGEILEDFIFLHGLEIENRGDIPTFSTLRGATLATSFIDITLSRDVSIVDWYVDESFNNSDHNTLSYEILTHPNPPTLVRPWKKANWTRFSRILENYKFYSPEIMSPKKLDKMVHSLYKGINYALNKACPLRPSKAEDHNLKWWSSKLSSESKKLNKQHRIAKRCKTLTETVKLKIMKNKFKKMCRKEKKTCWRKFTFNIKENDRMASLAKTLQNKERSKLYTLRKPDGSMTEPGQETLNLLFQTHFPASVTLRQVQYRSNRFAHLQSSSSYISQTCDYWLNVELLNKAFKKFNKKKSPGPDGLKPIIFDFLPENVKRLLVFLFKCCVHFHYTPVLWKDTKVIFIPKPGKDDYSLPKSFRPISLSNYFLKTFERLVCWKMDDSLRLYPLHDRQHGFMPGRSTESAISVTTNYIEKFIVHSEHCLALFLDISAAFDSIDIDHVKRALLKHGGDPDVVGWYHNYLSHRNLYAELHQDSASCSTGVGFPQGGVCSARFWLIAFNQAIKIINNNFVEGIGYADDCCILMGGTDQVHMVAQVQRAVNKLVAWGNSCGLRFNHSKTVAILFSSNNKKFSRHIKIQGNVIPYSDRVKYLGVTLDRKLSWNTHIKEKARACKRFLFMVARITKSAYGPSPKIMRWTFQSIVRPMMTYGALCWAHKISTGSIDGILRNLNRAGMNTYSNFPRSSPTRTVEIITDTMPLSLYAHKVGLSSRIRLRNIVNSDWLPPVDTSETASGHINFWDQQIVNCNLEQFLEPDDSVQLTLPYIKYQVHLNSFSGHPKYLSPSQLNVYTDGSKLNNRVGAGVYITRSHDTIASLSFRLPDQATVFQAEILAINKAAIYIQSLENTNYIKIFVDSQAALQALSKKDITSRLVGDTVHNLNLIPGLVRLVWIKAHVGHDGNERADELAKAGTSLPTAEPVALPKQATKHAIKEAIDEIWKLEWSLYNDGRQSKQFYQLPDRKKAKYCYNLSRQELGRLIRIVTGHNNLFYHRSNVDKSGATNSLCRFCKEEKETFYHFATSCPCFRLSRFQFFQNDTCFVNGKWSVRQLLDFSNIPSISAALGGSFDPMVHLEQQRDFEDLIEAEQSDADLQPGRTYDPDNPIHYMSASDSSDEIQSSQYDNVRDNILRTRQLHPISSSNSDSSTSRLHPTNPDGGLEEDAASTDTDSTSDTQQAPAKKQKMNYDTLDLTDDEY